MGEAESYRSALQRSATSHGRRHQTGRESPQEEKHPMVSYIILIVVGGTGRGLETGDFLKAWVAAVHYLNKHAEACLKKLIGYSPRSAGSGHYVLLWNSKKIRHFVHKKSILGHCPEPVESGSHLNSIH
jgi:hypothetical protein